MDQTTQQVVNGISFPRSPGPGKKFRDDRAKWKAVAEALAFARSCLSSSDRGFYRQLIGVEALARSNVLDRGGQTGEVGEPVMPWLDGLRELAS